jgi:hypothetical protein
MPLTSQLLVPKPVLTKQAPCLILLEMAPLARPHEIFQQGMEILRAAKKDLHEAHMNLRNAVAEAKQALGTEDHDHTETAQ